MARPKKSAPEPVQDQSAPEVVQDQPAPEVVQDGLVAMQKDGEEIRAHPTCVQSHKNAGWKVAE